MIFRNFKIQILLRLLVIVLLITLTLYYVFTEYNIIRISFLFAFIVAAIWNLFWYINKTNKDLRLFVLSILNEDFTTRFSDPERGQTYQALYQSFNQINETLRQLSTEREANYNYLQTLIQQIPVGIVSFDENGKLHLVNDTMLQWYQLDHAYHIESLESANSKLTNALIAVPANQTEVISMEINNSIHRFSISVSKFKRKGISFTLVVIQDIRHQLEENEMQAWQKLIRVLTHEIMNSIAPVTSLSSSLLQLTSKAENEINAELYEKLNKGLSAIENRSSGLMSFTQAYRQLTKVPRLNLEPVQLQPYLASLINTLSADQNQLNISFSPAEGLEKHETMIDQALFRQVIINLVKNAEEAIMENLSDSGIVTISLTLNYQDHVQINITDNGGGIAEDIQDQLFIPFFTTKPGGSGIGLSLSMQIIRLHGGHLSFETSLDQCTTTFSITL